MAINLPSGFNITTTESIDNRLILTKVQMKGISFKKMPDKYFCMCPEDNKFYIFDSSIPVEEEDPETGCFRPLDDYLTFDTPEAKDNFIESVKEAIVNSEAIKQEIALSLKLDGNEITADTGV